VAMIAFVWVLLQELITGKGVITTFTEAKSFDEVVVPAAIAGVFFLGMTMLTVKIALGDEDDPLDPDAVLKELNAIDDVVKEELAKKKQRLQ